VRQLLHVLALNADRAMHREELAELMWPDQPPRDAIHRLQVAISQLRRALCVDGGPEVPLVERDGECYRLCLPPGSRVDVLEFESALRRARGSHRAGERWGEAGALQDALDCYRGDLLPEEGPSDWVVERRDELRRGASSAASDLAGLLTETDPRAAVTAAERSVTIDPYNDLAWRRLIALHEDLGDVARAEQARSAYASVLSELGVT
jgi:DNA-binding SARP family transcriptional activator